MAWGSEEQGFHDGHDGEAEEWGRRRRGEKTVKLSFRITAAEVAMVRVHRRNASANVRHMRFVERRNNYKGIPNNNNNPSKKLFFSLDRLNFILFFQKQYFNNDV